MSFVITRTNGVDEEEEEKFPEPIEPQQLEEGFVITPADQKEEETSYGRALGGAAKDFLSGFLDIGIKAFGGGPGSPMAQSEKWKREGRPILERQLAEMELKNKGLSEEEIQEELGPPPEPEKIIESFKELGDIITGGALIPKTATERTIQRAGETAGEFVGIGALMPGGGALARIPKEARTGALFGTGMQIAEEGEGGPISQLTSGALLASLPYLMLKGKAGISKGIEYGKRLLGAGALPEGVPKFLEKVGPEALADLELSQRDLVGRVAKTSDEMLAKFEESVGKVAEPSFKDVGTFRAADIESEIIKANQKAILDTISPVAETQKKSWEGLQNHVEENFKAVKETYRNLYETSENLAKNIEHELTNTYEAAQRLKKETQGGLLIIGEETKISSTASTLQRKLLTSQKNKARKLIEDLKKEGIEADYNEVLSMMDEIATKEMDLRKIPLDKAMKTKRSVNRLLAKSDIIPAPIDLLKPIARALKKDIMIGLEKNPRAKSIYEAAENQFAEAQRVFNNDAMVKMRKTQNPEDLTSMFTKPSNLERLNEAIGDNPQVKDFVDRLVVENIAGKSKEVAREMAKESREYISKKGKAGLDKILEYGNELTSPGQQAIARGRILEDIQKASSTGARPTGTLKMMQDPVGYNLVKDTLTRSPKGKKMFKGLQRMTFEDMMSSVIGKDKQINFEKARDIFNDPHLRSIVKESMGEEGMKFFSQLERYGKNMAENIQKLAVKDRPFFQRMIDNYFDKGLKYALWATVPFTAGKTLLPILGAEIAKKSYRAQLFKVLENPKSRDLIKQMGQKNVPPQKMQELMKRFAQVSGRPSKEKKD